MTSYDQIENLDINGPTGRAWREAWRDAGWGWDENANFDALIDLVGWAVHQHYLWARTQAALSLIAADKGDHATSVALLREISYVASAVEKLHDTLFLPEGRERLDGWARQYWVEKRECCGTAQSLFAKADALFARGRGKILNPFDIDDVCDALGADLLAVFGSVDAECFLGQEYSWRAWCEQQVIRASEDALRREVNRLREHATDEDEDEDGVE